MANLEYIFFNLLVLAGPLFFSFDARVRYVRHWPAALLAAAVLLVPFVIWDSLVTGRHWWFNQRYTSGTFLGVLPLGEWLFFLSVPFASLFIWEILRSYRPARHSPRHSGRFGWIWLGLPIAALLLWLGKEYTALVIFAFVLMAQADIHFGGRVITMANIWPYFAILFGLMLFFNGYLTARPVVLYDPQYQLDWRLITIPAEDFLYGYSLILGCTSLFEKLRNKNA